MKADSILFSPSIINHHFSQTNTYIYTAARLNNPKANYQLYLETNNPYWLKEAAHLNHIPAVYQWYLIQRDNQHVSQYVWLQQAINLDYAPAMLIKLNELINKKEWALAKVFKQQYSQQLARLQGDKKKQYQEIDSLLNLSLKNQKTAKVTKFDAQHSNPDIPIELKCDMTIQTVLESDELLDKAKEFEQAFKTSKINDLSICFLPAQTLPELKLFCELDGFNRIDCNLDSLAYSLLTNLKVNPKSYNRVLVIVEQGDANTRGGLMYLDKKDSQAVFIHELAHWLGYVDEYQIKAQQQDQLCKVATPRWISPNLYVAAQHISKDQVELLAGQTLYLANTCKGSGFNAYKKRLAPSFMEYLDLPLSEQYAQEIKSSIDLASTLPVAMNFWVNYSEAQNKSITKTTKQFNKKQYLTWLKIAANQKYRPAMTLLAQHYIETNAYSNAYTLLLESAELGNANAQLLLGHGFIEGRWLPQDAIQSAYWYKQAAEQNDPYGLYFYGKCHEMGWGCELSVDKSIIYYKKAKAAGSQLATDRLSLL